MRKLRYMNLSLFIVNSQEKKKEKEKQTNKQKKPDIFLIRLR